MLTATKKWTCNCGCDESINIGERFLINGQTGDFYKEGHEPEIPKKKIVLKKKTGI
jgi:hypothetical protein